MLDFIQFRLLDGIDIVLVALLLWQIYRAIRGTSAMAIFTAIFLLYAAWVVVRALGMELLSMVLGQVLGIGGIALLIVFQQEVRRYLLMLGNRWASNRKSLFSRIFTSRAAAVERTNLDELAVACRAMAENRTGALIVLARSTDIAVYIETGDRIDAEISRRLIENLFFKNSPLHDGAVIIAEGRIAAARCILPTSDNPNIPAHLGLRHRAAVGLSEHSDALVVVVSEERGLVSLVRSGAIRPVGAGEDLAALLAAELDKN